MSIVSLLFSINGRITRLAFWLIMIPYVVIVIVFNGAVDELIDYDDRTGSVPLWVWLVGLLLSILLLWIYFATLIKRLHDRDKSAKWLLIAIIPIIGLIWTVVELGCLRGTEGPNRYSLPTGSES